MKPADVRRNTLLLISAAVVLLAGFGLLARKAVSGNGLAIAASVLMVVGGVVMIVSGLIWRRRLGTDPRYGHADRTKH
ncbi:MAG: hypothetical protein L0G99_03395 [Propionibacteriales bacterium]|nr:hypothetical protein [Propionibacteriales bacterium]